MSKKCKACKKPFEPWNSLTVVCSIKCALVQAENHRKHEDRKAGALVKKNEKAARKQLRARKEALKSRGDWLREAQAAFNKWIRVRDKGRACISCGAMPNFSSHIGGSGIQAGHYRSVGSSPELRFEPFNCHVQCYKCNVHLSGNAIEYRVGLIKKIGIEKTEWVEGLHKPKKYTIEDIKAIKVKYRKISRDLEKSLE